MAKIDKSNKKAASKKANPIKEKPVAVPASSREILAKAAALAKPLSNKALANGKKTLSTSSDNSSESSSSAEDSSSGESSDEASPPVKPTPISVKKTADPSGDSSDASSSEESSSDDSDASSKGKVSALVKTAPAPIKKAADSLDSSSAASSEDSDSDDQVMASVSTKTSPIKGEKKLDSEDDSSDVSSSSSESDSDEEDGKTSVPAQTTFAEGKKRKADGEAAAVPKKVKLANESANAATSGDEKHGIFVGKLSWNVDNDWLAQEFAECGEVESAHVQMDRNTGRSRGFGYVHFKTADAVEKALALNGKEIDGRAVNVDKSNPPDKKPPFEKRAQAFGDVTSPPSAVLFVGNVSFGVNEDTLWETFGEHGDVKSVRIPTDRDSGKPKGFAYVEFSEVGAAKKAHGALQGFDLDGRTLRLDFSQPRDSAGGRGGGQGGRGGWGRGGFGGDRGRGRGGFGGDRGRGGFGGDRGRGGGRGGRGGDRGGRGRGRGARTGGITHFEGQKITFD